MRRGAVLWICATCATLSLAGESLVFELERYNGVYSGSMAEVRPIERGPLTILLTSPRYEIEILAHRLELQPAAGGLHRALGWSRFSGDGDLEADVRFGAVPASFADRVVIPEQEKEIEALVRLEHHEAGYLVTLEELPESVTIAVESELAASLVSFCTSVSRFTFGDAGCDALDRALSNPQVPLPEPGTRFVLRESILLAAERERLERYLENAASGPSGGDETSGVVDPVGSARPVP